MAKQPIATLSFDGGQYPVATRSRLDGLPCDKCGRSHAAPLVLAPKCHRKAGLEAFYFRGVLGLRCGRCHETILAVPIADELPPETHYAGKPGSCADHERPP